LAHDALHSALREIRFYAEKIAGGPFRGEAQFEIARALRMIESDIKDGSTSEETMPSIGRLDLKLCLQVFEQDLIHEALRRTDGNKTKASELLGIKRTTLIEKLKRFR
jgi:transcriptional regulator with PAS, ATPase and Fis domain